MSKAIYNRVLTEEESRSLFFNKTYELFIAAKKLRIDTAGMDFTTIEDKQMVFDLIHRVEDRLYDLRDFFGETLGSVRCAQ